MTLKIKYILVVFFALVICAKSSRSQGFAAVDSFNYYYDQRNYINALSFWGNVDTGDYNFELKKRYGNCYFYQRLFDSSLIVYQKIFKTTSPKDTLDLIDISINLGNAWKYNSSNDSAFFYLKMALELNKSFSNKHESRLYQAFGSFFEGMKSFDSAEYYYLKSLKSEIQVATDSSDWILYNYEKLAQFYISKGDFEKAILYCNLGLKVVTKFDHAKSWWLFNLYYSIGRAYYSMRNWQEVVIYFNKALHHMSRSRKSFEPYIKNILAYCYAQIGEQSLNEQYFNGISVNNHDALAYTYYLSNFGNYFENHQRDYPKALEKYQHGLKISLTKFGSYSIQTITNYWEIGRTYHKYQKYDSSLYYFQRALYCNSKDVDTLNYATNPQDVFNADKRLPEIIARKLESLMAIKHQGLEQDSLRTINQLMVANCSYYSHCVEAGLRDKTFMQDRMTALKKEIRRYMLAGMDAAWELYHDNHDACYLQKALHFSEAGKHLLVKSMMMQRNQATQLPDSIAQMNTLLSNNINSLHLRKVQLEANNDTLLLADLQQKLFSLILQQDSLRNIIYHKYPANINREFNELSLHEISGSVKAGQLLINYFLEDTVLHVLKISPDTITWQRFQHAQNIRNRVNDLIDFCNPLSNRIIGKQTYQDIATELTGVLVGDTGMFHIIKELVIIPDQELVLLPFEILLKYNPGVNEFYKQLPYLLHEFPISYYHSLYGLQSNSKRINTPSRGFVAIAPRFEGNAVQMRQGYIKIEQAMAEAEYLTGLFDGALLTGNQAKKSNLGPYLQNASVIHFATHTKTDTSGLMNTGLVLPSDTSQNVFDPLLTSEICCMDIPADMVMLSACQSGSGQLLDGEGVISLGWAFEYAGSRSVGYSLFSLDDASANRIMTSFYKGLKEGLPKNVALQQAKQDFLKTTTSIKTHPKYWAGLEVVGGQSPISGLASVTKKLSAIRCLAGFLILFLLLTFLRHRKHRKNFNTIK